VIGRTPGTPSYQQRLAGHLAAVSTWLKAAQMAWRNDQSLDPNPTFPV